MNGLTEPLSILTGPPGSGKTWSLSLLAAAAGKDKIIGCAPSAAAAQRLFELTGIESMTAHRLLGWPRAPLSAPNINNLLGHRWLIIDEASMLDVYLMAALLRVAANANIEHVKLVGDADQLPPVELGEPFRDLIASGLVPTVRLTEIYRAAKGGGIFELCNDIRQGAPLFAEADYGDAAVYHDGNGAIFAPKHYEDVAFLHEPDPAALAAITCQYYKTLIDSCGAHPDEIMVLTPFNGREYGADALNIRIRAMLGHDGPAAPGDLVRHCKNYVPHEDLVNGMRGKVAGYTKKSGDLVVEYYGRHFAYPAKTVCKSGDPQGRVCEYPAENVAWAYAGTVHKAQGSEYKHVIVIIPPGGLYLFGQAHFYTGASRAQRSLLIIGDLSDIPAIVARGRHRRVTALPYLLGGSKEAAVGKTDWTSAGITPPDQGACPELVEGDE